MPAAQGKMGWNGQPTTSWHYIRTQNWMSVLTRSLRPYLKVFTRIKKKNWKKKIFFSMEKKNFRTSKIFLIKWICTKCFIGKKFQILHAFRKLLLMLLCSAVMMKYITFIFMHAPSRTSLKRGQTVFWEKEKKCLRGGLNSRPMSYKSTALSIRPRSQDKKYCGTTRYKLFQYM